jgi:hypothetical protein
MERDADAALETLKRTMATPPLPPDADARLTAARRLAADRDADEDWEDVVSTMTDRDTWIADVVRRGCVAIAAAPDAIEWTESLAREALAALSGEPCVLIVPADLVSPLEARRPALEECSAKRITIEAGSLAAGCIGRTADGRVTFDNSLEARARRMQTRWRAILAKAYDEAALSAHAVEHLTTAAGQP